MILIPTHRIIDRASLRARARSCARLPKNFKTFIPPLRPQYDHRAAPDTRSHISVGRRARGQTAAGALISIVSRARPASHARARSPATPRAPIVAPIVARSRSPRARDVPARRRERSRARAHLIKIEPARGARSRDEALARRRPGRRRGDQAVRTRRDATTMRSRVDASARRARARRDDDARRGIRDEIDRRRVFVPPSTGRRATDRRPRASRATRGRRRRARR